MTPLERAARAIRHAASMDPAQNGDLPDWERFVPQARAAVDALREPSEGMLQGACTKHTPGLPMSATTPHWRGREWDSDEECPSFVKRRKIWTAMIDAALSEGG